MPPPLITDADLAAAQAGDRVGPEDAAWFLGETEDQLARWRRTRTRGGPPFQRLGPRLVRYAMSDLVAWRLNPGGA